MQILSTVVLLLWALVAFHTAQGAWRGNLFYAPCLQNLTIKNEDDGSEGDQHRA